MIVKNPGYSKSDIKRFINAKREWIFKKIDELKNKISIRDLYEDENIVLILGKKKSLHVKDLVSFYRDLTKVIVLKEVKEISKLTSLYPKKISFRKTKRRWGSCNGRNEITFSITLAQLPKECVRYIVLHELAHIRFKNHQREFYDFIKRYMPNYKELEKEIKYYSPMV